MGWFSEKVKNKIQLIKSEEIRTLLLNSLNEKAEGVHDLFCSHPAEQRLKHRLPLHYPENVICAVTENNISGIIFNYAPRFLCIKLADILIKLNADEAITLLISENNVICPVNALFCHSPDEVKTILIDWIASLSSAQLAKLLGYRFSVSYIIHNKEENLSIKLLKACQKLKPEIIFDFFYSGSFTWTRGDSWYEELAKLFRKSTLSISLSMELLNLIEQLAPKDLFRLFKVTVCADNYYGNLFYSLFSNYPESVIKKALQLTEQFTDSEMKNLINFNTKERKNEFQIPIRNALKSNNLDAIRSLIHLMQTRPIFKQYLVLQTSFRDESLIHRAAKYANEEMVAYFLEQEEFKVHHKSVLKIAKRYKNNSIIELFKAYPIYQAIYDKYENHDIRQQTLTALIPLIKSNPQLLKVKWTNQKTLLHHAAKRGSPLAIVFLIKLGADINAKDREGKTPLDEALVLGRSAAVQSLLSPKQEKQNFSQMDEPDLLALITLGQSTPKSFSELISELIAKSSSSENVHHLDLTHFEFTEQGFNSFLPILDQVSSHLFPQINRLTLEDCHLAGQKMKQLVPLLIQMPGLTHLNLDNNFLDVKEVSSLLGKLYTKSFRSNLEELSLRNNRLVIDDRWELESLKENISSLAPLQKIHLEGNMISEERWEDRLEYKKLLENLHLIMTLLLQHEPMLTIRGFVMATFINFYSTPTNSGGIIELELEEKRPIKLSLDAKQYHDYSSLCYDTAHGIQRLPSNKIFSYLQSVMAPKNLDDPVVREEQKRKKQMKEFLSYHPNTNIKGVFKRQSLFFSQQMLIMPSLLFPEKNVTKQKGYVYLFANTRVYDQHAYLGYEFLTAAGQRVFKIAHFTTGNPNKVSFKKELNGSSSHELNKFRQHNYIAQFEVDAKKIKNMHFEILREINKDYMPGKYQWLIAECSRDGKDPKEKQLINCLIWCLDKMSSHLDFKINPKYGLYITREVVQQLIKDPESVLVRTVPDESVKNKP
jgi:ankyrin repeat protein